MSPAKIKSATSLLNKTILITRPKGRELHLCQIIEQAGGNAVHYPVFTIKPPSSLQIKAFKALQERLHDFDMAIYISPTAVEQSQLYFPVLPEHITIASIGSKTTQTLLLHHLQVTLEAPDHNTESLLKLLALQQPEIQGKNILIFRGNGGRALLGDSLTRKGAKIHYVETYRRQIATQPPLASQQLSKVNAITISSNEGLENLMALLGSSQLLLTLPLVVASQRAATLACQYGFKTIIRAKDATDKAFFIALSDYFSADNQH